MRRLYLRIYLTLLASLALFAGLTALGWWAFGERFPPTRDERALIAEVVQALLPPADAPADEQRETLARWHERSGVDLAVFDADGRPVASAGRPLPAPRPGDDGDRSGWSRRGEGPPVYALRLPDGRWAVARPFRMRVRPPFAWGAAFVALLAAVGVAAYPLVRRLTRRLERLHAGVEALGAGDLSARVPVQGRDEIARLADAFNRSAQRIESLVGANRSLLANASHELRSPLARLKMAVALLADGDGPADAEARAALRAEIERNVAELDALVDEVLLSSRLDAGAEVVREPVDLLPLVAEEASRVHARVSVADGVSGAMVDGDPRLLRRMLRNLFENARRHGGAGEIEADVGRDGDDWTIDVVDRGPGVPEAMRERIFEPFFRLAGHGEGSGGVGLGLALVRQIARRHGGEATCRSRDGGGSRFRVVLSR